MGKKKRGVFFLYIYIEKSGGGPCGKAEDGRRGRAEGLRKWEMVGRGGEGDNGILLCIYI